MRAYVAPVQLFEDPVGWFKRGILSAIVGGPFDTTKIIDLLEALKPFVGLAGTPRGVWPVTAGVELSVTAGGDRADARARRRRHDLADRTRHLRGRCLARPHPAGRRGTAPDDRGVRRRAGRPERRRRRRSTAARRT